MIYDPFYEPLIVLPREIARRVHISEKWLEKEARAGRLPHLEADGKIYFEPVAVEKALAERAKTEGLADPVNSEDSVGQTGRPVHA